MFADARPSSSSIVDPNLLLSTRDNHLVLRARPSGALISPTAHNLLREYTVLSRLNHYNAYLRTHRADLGQDESDEWLVPVPRTYGYYPGDDKRKDGQDKVGMPEFYVMEFKEGNVFEDCEYPELEDEEEKAEWQVPGYELMTFGPARRD